MFDLHTRDFIVLTRAAWCHALEHNMLDPIGEPWWEDAFLANRAVVVVETIGL